MKIAPCTLKLSSVNTDGTGFSDSPTYQRTVITIPLSEEQQAIIRLYTGTPITSLDLTEGELKILGVGRVKF